MQKLIVATHNAHKLDELTALLQKNVEDFPVDTIVSAGSLGVSEPVEDGATFEENALIKARHVFEATGLPSLADDSGLIVDILGSAPGIFSARWAGKHGDDNANNALLLAQLSGLPDKLRRARFIAVCALVYRDKNGQVQERITRGEMHGQIAHEMRGGNGFGYDVLFITDDSGVFDPNFKQKLGSNERTNSQLTPDEKNAISHRAKALQMMVSHIVEIF